MTKEKTDLIKLKDGTLSAMAFIITLRELLDKKEIVGNAPTHLLVRLIKEMIDDNFILPEKNE